jgi:acyl carrier protein
MTSSPPRRIEAPLHQWLTTHLAVYLDRPPENIDPTVPLATYGMDSVCALSLCGDIEETFGFSVDPSLAWDHPTVGELAAHLAARGADASDRWQR